MCGTKRELFHDLSKRASLYDCPKESKRINPAIGQDETRMS